MENDSTEKIRDELSAYLRKNLRTGERTDDIVQEAFSRLYGSPGFSEEKIHFGYLLSICRNIIRDEYARGGKSISLNDDLSISGKHLEEYIFSQLDRDFIRESLMQLSEEERMLLHCRYNEDLGFKAIAERMNLNLNTVLSRHMRLLKKLKPRFESYFFPVYLKNKGEIS